MTVGDLSRRDSEEALGVLWGKSNAGGTVHLLLAHLLDASAVGELIWDRYLAASLRAQLDACCEGRGKELFSLVCGLHDVGKASPAFQGKVPELASAVRGAGLDWPELPAVEAQRWHHTLAGAFVLRRVLRAAGWSRDAISWIWPLVAGHHGSIPDADRLTDPPVRGHAQGFGAWPTIQDGLVQAVTDALDLDLGAEAPAAVPSRGVQLAFSGAVIMADWIASDDKHFPGLAHLSMVGIERARCRAQVAWDGLGLAGGWRPGRLVSGLAAVERRFRVTARPVQSDVVKLAERMPSPGILLVEAPMGEGKTEAALAAAEVLSRRFGANGVFVGMPTQATSDPMFSRVRTWAGSVDPDVPVALLHGKRRFNAEWRELEAGIRFAGVDGMGEDELGVPDPYRASSQPQPHRPSEAPAEWFLGRNRGLLVPVTVGTVDQLLHAATRTRHVMLRHAGLAGRVVVLDEVHAYDVYMAQFLFEALRWLADQGVAVVLLSATLPPTLRRDLVRAYLQGAAQSRDPDLDMLPEVSGYPSALSVCPMPDGAVYEVSTGSSWRPDLRVSVDIRDEGPGDEPDGLVDLIRETTGDRGCVLVVRNTVARAQQTYLALRDRLDWQVMLLHGRLTAGERSDRTERVLDLLGPPGREHGAARPARLVVVATQLAEQSFDVDVDLLITDLAPIDLLLQRVGRLHRHDRALGTRPEALQVPRVVVTGMSRRADAPPDLPTGSRKVYGAHPLLRAAALVEEAAQGKGWSIPADVPDLVRRGYADQPAVPETWSSVVEQARQEWQLRQVGRAASAQDYLLAGLEGLGARTLAGLHARATADLGDDEKVAAVVRDGDPSVEVVLVRWDESRRRYLTLDGRSLGPTGEAVADDAVMERVIGATIRLPAIQPVFDAALAELRPLPGWTGDSWLRRTRAFVLDGNLSANLGGYRFRYDHELGLIRERR